MCIRDRYSALPIVLVLLQSIKPLNELFIYPPRFFVVNPTMDNFKQLPSLMAASKVPFARYIFNSLFVSVIGTIGHIILASMCAYPLAKMNLKGGNAIFTLIVTSLMFAPAVSDIINYQTISSLHLLDNYMAIILPALGSSLGLYIMKQFMSQIPDALIAVSYTHLDVYKRQGMDELGLVLSGVTEGIIEGLVADDDSNSSDSDNSTPDEDNSAETGVTTAAAAAVVIMISASVAVILIQKKRMQNK